MQNVLFLHAYYVPRLEHHCQSLVIFFDYCHVPDLPPGCQEAALYSGGDHGIVDIVEANAWAVASGAEITQIIQVLQNCLEPEPRSKDLKIPQQIARIEHCSPFLESWNLQPSLCSGSSVQPVTYCHGLSKAGSELFWGSCAKLSPHHHYHPYYPYHHYYCHDCTSTSTSIRRQSIKWSLSNHENSPLADN